MSTVLLGLLIGALVLLVLCLAFRHEEWTVFALAACLALVVGAIGAATLLGPPKLDVELRPDERDAYVERVSGLYRDPADDEWTYQLENDACIALSGFGMGKCKACETRMADADGEITEASMQAFLKSLDDDELLRVGGYTLHARSDLLKDVNGS